MFILRFFLTTIPCKNPASLLQELPCWGAIVFLLATILGAMPAQASHQDAQTTAPMLYRERCALCHHIDKAEFKFAPSLQGLFKRQNLLIGKPVNEQNITEIISNGTPNMPAFRYSLTEEEIRQIVAFLKGSD